MTFLRISYSKSSTFIWCENVWWDRGGIFFLFCSPNMFCSVLFCPESSGKVVAADLLKIENRKMFTKNELEKTCKEFERNSKVDVARPIGQTNDRSKFIVVVSHLFRKKALIIKIIYTQLVSSVAGRFHIFNYHVDLEKRGGCDVVARKRHQNHMS